MAKETVIPVEKYAAQQRISIYKVMQMANRGELKAVIREEEGKKRTYIILSDDDAPAAAAAPETSKASEGEIDYKAAYEALQKEMQALQEKADKKG